MKKPELLIPAGNLEKLKIACIYGADAVFLGGYEFGLRSNSDNFSFDDIKEGCEICKQYGVDVYVTTNIYAHEENFDGFINFVKHLEACGVTGIIVSDPGYIHLCQQYAPNVEIHISTQHSITNYEAVNYYQKLGAQRVVLARELSFDEIKTIVDHSNCEIEIFIHGAVCSSYSGRCTLSNHMTSRDSNRGGCCQSCRWNYQLVSRDVDGNFTPVVLNDETIDFNMSAKDMDTLKYLPQILELGVDSLKVEGRMKTYHYVATVTKVYREAIDAYFQDPQHFNIKPDWIEELKKAESREAYIGAFIGDLGVNDQIYKEQYKLTTGFDFVGMIVGQKDGWYEIEQRNLFTVDDDIELLIPNQANKIINFSKLYNEAGEEIMRANHPLMKVFFQSQLDLPEYTMLRKIVK